MSEYVVVNMKYVESSVSNLELAKKIALKLEIKKKENYIVARVNSR
jgi:hypothetical protein